MLSTETHRRPQCENRYIIIVVVVSKQTCVGGVLMGWK